jgi:WhiB family redox-sensing transcriptional regulator
MDHIDARAVAACVGCPVRGDCLAAALNGHEPHGVWGGLTPDARRRLARTRSNRRLIAAETRTRTVA